MVLKNNLTEFELNLLNKANLKIADKDYTFDEIDDLIERLDIIISNHLDESQNFTELSLEYEKIQDKLLDLEN